MGLFGSKENLEDIRYNAMSMMERNQPKAAVSLFNKILKQIHQIQGHCLTRD